MVAGIAGGVLIGVTWLDWREADARSPAEGFASCAQAKAARVGPMWFFYKGYRPELDADGDGRACEWNGRRSLTISDP
jgi:hypothetical protein